MYFKRTHENYIVFIIFGVTNFILAFNNLILAKETKANSLKKFKMVDLNDIYFFRGYKWITFSEFIENFTLTNINTYKIYWGVLV
jgi:hypothetical protein